MTTLLPVGECPRVLVSVGGGSAETGYPGDGILLDLATGGELIHTAQVPGLDSVDELDGTGLPVFCNYDDLVGYARALLAQVTQQGQAPPERECAIERYDWENAKITLQDPIGSVELTRGRWSSDPEEDGFGATVSLRDHEVADLSGDGTLEAYVALEVAFVPDPGHRQHRSASAT